MTPQEQRKLAEAVVLAAPSLGAVLATFTTPLGGAALTGLLVAAAKVWELGLDPQAELEAIAGYEEPLAEARRKVEAAEDAKFGPDELAPRMAAAVDASARETADDVYPDPDEDS